MADENCAPRKGTKCRRKAVSAKRPVTYQSAQPNQLIVERNGCDQTRLRPRPNPFMKAIYSGQLKLTAVSERIRNCV